MGAILSPLQIYGYTFEKNCLKIIFLALLMLDTVVNALRGSCFPDLWVSFFGSAAGFIGAIFKAKMAHPHIKRFELPPPPSYYCSLAENIFPLAVVGCLFGATYENTA